MNRIMTLALVAHDNKKEALADFILDHRAALSRFHLVATRGTGTLLRKRTGLPVTLLEHGSSGGEEQLGEIVAESRVQAVIVFRDPISPGPYEPDFDDLMQVCDRQEIPLATNRATAEALLYFLRTSPDRGAIAARPWGYV